MIPVEAKNVKKNLSKLSKRAAVIKSNPKLRHTPNARDIQKALENVHVMQVFQFQAIKN